MFKRLIEVGAKILDILDDTYVLSAAATNFSYECSFDSNAFEAIKPIVTKEETIFHDVVGYSGIKREFVKSLNSSKLVSILLSGPPGCGKSEFLKQIRNHFEEVAVFVDGSYCSKAGIFQVLYDK